MNTTSHVRQSFLDYFGQHSHAVMPSSSLVPHNDPTLMFTAAGMVQFKNVFTGLEKLPSTRAATAQKCVRAGGKHNDLDNVGYTARHHTFFEMLGNFSFGDYFKEEAIILAWNLLTGEWGLAPDKLCVTVYHDDDFAWNTWKKITGFTDDKIIRINSSDNFWSAGDTGPCGPCSEIFYDHGDHIAGGPPGSPDQDGDRFVEIWNLVFMQYDQLPPPSPPLAGGIEGGRRVNLPKPSIDTGMGLERISAVMQSVHDNYEIDLFKHLIHAITEISGVSGAGSAAHKVIADHLRASCFLMADGVMPSNEGRGYVLRRIMRRAMRYAHQLGCQEPLMHKLVPALVTEMGLHYPELGRAQATITENLRAEEERFKETLERGLRLLEESLTPDTTLFSGETAFKLYDTYGFPLDLTQDILRGKNIAVDIDGFDSCMERQKEMARASHKGSGDAATGKIWFELKERVGATAFVGYEQEEAAASVLAIVKGGQDVPSADAGDEVMVILNQTPFYGESGGQAGDTGVIRCGDVHSRVSDTQKPLEDFFVHHVQLAHALAVGQSVHAVVDSGKRNQTRANHSATHLLHKALRDQLGVHVTQKGSLVNDEKLRFDFSHGKGLSAEDTQQIEAQVMQAITRDTPVVCKEMAPEDAINAGAMALFGEKYGDRVRVLSIGANDKGDPYSVELCGGTHVQRTGDIGAFKIISEGSVASGIRRIEAITGERVRRYMLESLQKLQAQLDKQLLDYQQSGGEPMAISPADLKVLEVAGAAELNTHYMQASQRLNASIQQVSEANKKLQKKLAEEKAKQALSGLDDAVIERIGDAGFTSKHVVGISPKELRPVAENLLKRVEPGVVVATSENEGKIAVIVAVSPSLTGRLDAVKLVQHMVAALGGSGGGGRPEMAQGGAADASQLAEAIAGVKEIIK